MSSIRDKKNLEGYASYLEARLEKLSHPILQLDDQIPLLFNKISSMEEKITKLTKVVKLVQTYTEEQDQETHNVNYNEVIKRIVIRNI